jgi:hypothetical protein
MERPLVRAICEEDARQSWTENLGYSLDVFDVRDNLVEVLGRLADLETARSAFAAAVAKYPSKRNAS